MNTYQDQIFSGDSAIAPTVAVTDTLSEQPMDTNPVIDNLDTLGIPNNLSIPESQEVVPQVRQEQTQLVRQNNVLTQNTITLVKKDSSSGENVDSSAASVIHLPPSLSIFSRSDRPFYIKSHEIWEGAATEIPSDEPQFNPRNDELNNLNWTLAVGVISVLLILYLKTYYQKFVTRVMNTLVNFQLADTMLREKNSIVKRAFLIMNLNYILILGLFSLLIARMYDMQYFNESWKDYLLIIAIISSIMILRYILFYAVGWIFEWMPAVTNHLHNTYLINKNMGLLLLPVVFMGIYTAPFFSRIILFAGIITITIAIVFRLIRGFQVLIKNGILLFYAILYLCTLELLPLVIGSKLIIMLR